MELIKNNSFRSHVQGERIYVNPSITFRPDKMTNITVEMDYMNDRRTPDRGTVNWQQEIKKHYIQCQKVNFRFCCGSCKTETLTL